MADRGRELLVSGKPISSLRVVDLKLELEKRSLPKSGSKKDLLERLRLHLQLEEDREAALQDEEHVPNLSLCNETENDFIKEYLAAQQARFQVQREAKKQFEEKKRESEASAEEETTQDEDEPPVLTPVKKTSPRKTSRQKRKDEDDSIPDLTKSQEFQSPSSAAVTHEDETTGEDEEPLQSRTPLARKHKLLKYVEEPSAGKSTDSASNFSVKDLVAKFEQQPRDPPPSSLYGEAAEVASPKKKESPKPEPRTTRALRGRASQASREEEEQSFPKVVDVWSEKEREEEMESKTTRRSSREAVISTPEKRAAAAAVETSPVKAPPALTPSPIKAPPAVTSPVVKAPPTLTPSPAKGTPEKMEQQSPVRTSPAPVQEKPVVAEKSPEKPAAVKSPEKPVAEKSPVKPSSEKSPEKLVAEKSPEKPVAEKSPVKLSPEKVEPEKSPVKQVPKESPVKASPEKMEVEKSPEKPVPEKSPLKASPEKMELEKSPLKASPEKSPEKPVPEKSPLKASPEKQSPEKSPVKPSPEKLAEKSPEKPVVTETSPVKAVPEEPVPVKSPEKRTEKAPTASASPADKEKSSDELEVVKGISPIVPLQEQLASDVPAPTRVVIVEPLVDVVPDLVPSSADNDQKQGSQTPSPSKLAPMAIDNKVSPVLRQPTEILEKTETPAPPEEEIEEDELQMDTNETIDDSLVKVNEKEEDVSKPEPYDRSKSTSRSDSRSTPDSTDGHHRPANHQEPPKVEVGRKLKIRKQGSAAAPEPESGAPRKRKWGTSQLLPTKKPALVISTDSLKAIVPDAKPLSAEEVRLGSPIHQSPPKTASRRVQEDNDDDEEDVVPVPSLRRVVTVDETPPAPKPDVVLAAAAPLTEATSPARQPKASVLHVSNLVRPFTVNQLKELLARTGQLIEGKFWIDKVKSSCIVQYSNEDEAEETRAALHGIHWPTSNPKTLVVDYSTSEELENRLSGKESGLPVSNSRLNDQTMRAAAEAAAQSVGESRRDSNKAVREWDLGKESGEAVATTTKESEDQAETVAKLKEGVPAKLLDDLFRKTKTTPCIYWLPLTSAQIAEKEEVRRKRLAERELRIKEAEQQRTKEFEQRQKEREKQREAERLRARERDRERDRNRDRQRKRSRSSSTSSSSSGSSSSSDSPNKRQKRAGSKSPLRKR